jgi:hypothetical protein
MFQGALPMHYKDSRPFKGERSTLPRCMGLKANILVGLQPLTDVLVFYGDSSLGIPIQK